MANLSLEYEKDKFFLEGLIIDVLENKKLKLNAENKIIAILDNKKIYLGLRKEKILKEIKWIYKNKFNKEINIIVPYNQKANLKIKIKEKIKIEIIIKLETLKLEEKEIKEIKEYICRYEEGM